MPKSISGETRTPTTIKWLLNERAMLGGEVEQRNRLIDKFNAEADSFRQRMAALDTTMALLDERGNPARRRFGQKATTARLLSA